MLSFLLPSQSTHAQARGISTRICQGMTERAIIEAIARRLAGTNAVTIEPDSDAPKLAWGDTFFYYDPDRSIDMSKAFPFATIVTKDYDDFDNASNLNRDGIFRLNIGLSKKTFDTLFPNLAADAARSMDYAALDTLIPHPVYAKQHWVSALNPSDETFERTLWPLLVEAHTRAKTRN